jgi:cyclase
VRRLLGMAATTMALSGAGLAQDDRFADVEVTTQHVAGSVYMLKGAGGNVGASIGPDGTFMIDSDFASLGSRVLGAVVALGGDRPRLLLNTHVHGDHTGGNAFFGSAVIFAHENVRVRLLGEGTERPALPVVTFEDRVRLYFNDDEIDVIHVPRGHTDGDSIVWFRGANVVHMSDQFWNRLFPFIDTENGGTLEGYLENIDRALAMIDDDTKVIPGHGELGGKADLAAFAEMIRTTRAQVEGAVRAGQLEQLIETGLGPQWQPWGAWFIDEERWIRSLAAFTGS